MNDADCRIVIDGIELRERETGLWTYIPKGPGLERGADGAPLLSVIQAGATAFLQATARIDLPEVSRTTLLTKLRERHPNAREIRSDVADVPRVALEMKAAGDVWAPLAQGRSSSLPPFLAALSCRLHPAELEAVSAALGGERKRLRLAATVRLRNRPSRERRLDAVEELRVETQAGSAAAHTATHAREAGDSGMRTLYLATDIAEFYRATRTVD
jgi:hypothetical protein